MSVALMWVIAFAVFLIIETITLEFSCLTAGIGCLLAAAAAGLGLPFSVQVGIAGTVTVAGLFLVAPLLRRRLMPRNSPSPNAAIIGSEAEVVEAIVPPAQGKVKRNGVIWQAQSNHEIPAGARVIVSEVNGARLTVVAEAQIFPARTGNTAPLAPEAPHRPEPQQDLSH